MVGFSRRARWRHAALLLVTLASIPARAVSWPDAPFYVERDLASPDAAVRRAAADRIRTLSPSAATPLLALALRDPDVDVRIAAARAAVARHMGDAAQPVLEWLGERDARLRVAACEVLAQLRAPAATSPLARALGDAEPSVRAAAAAALGAQAASEAVPALLGKLDDSSPAVRVEVIAALARLGDPRAVIPLVGKAGDSVPEVRQHVARALGELGDARAAPALVLELRDPSLDVRSASIAALGQLRAASAADAIATFASDRSPAVRRAAIDALGRIGSPEAIRALLGVLGTGDDAAAGLRSSPSREALAAAGKPAVSPLRAHLAGPTTASAAASIAWVLGELRAREAIPDIVRAMRRGALATPAALHALGSMRSDEAVPVALEFVDDESASVRREALRAVGLLLDPAHPDGRAVEPLSSALRDARFSPSELALTASLLGRTGAPRAAPALEPLLFAQDPELRRAAIDALGALGPTGLDTPLVTLTRDPDPTVRLHAAIALGRAGGAAARDMLLSAIEDVDEGAPVDTRPGASDRAAALTALGGLLARAPSEAAVRVLAHALELASGPDRDAIILALGRSDLPAALPWLRALSASPNAADRRTLASVLPARRPTSATSELLSTLLSDRDATVRAAAAWALGEVGDASTLPALRALLRAPDPQPAIDAAAAIGRVLARTHAAAPSELCPMLDDTRAYVRANALAGLSLSESRCTDGAVERRLLREDSAPVRAAAARAIGRHPLGAADAGALDRCRARDPSGAVARICRAPSAPMPRAAPSTPEAVEVYVEGAEGKGPEPGAPYVLELPDGLARAGATDRRGAVFDPAVPGGDLALLPLSAER